MTTGRYLYAFVIWVVFFIANILNEMLRRALASPDLGEYGGHVTSIIRLVFFTIIMSYIFVSSLEVNFCSKADIFFVGFMWFILSVAYEIVYRRYFKYYPWSILLANYNIFEGRLRGLVLLTQLTSPYLIWLLVVRSVRKGGKRDAG